MTDNIPWKRPPEGKPVRRPVRRIPETYFPYSAATSKRIRKTVKALLIMSALGLGFIAAVGLVVTLGAIFGRSLGILIILAIVWATFYFGGRFRLRINSKGHITWERNQNREGRQEE